MKTKSLIVGILALAMAGIIIATPARAASDDGISDLIPPGSENETITHDEQDQAALDAAIERNQTNGPASATSSGIKSLFKAGGYKIDSASANLPGRVGRLITIVFAISGTIFLSMVIYSGIRWMTAGGDSDEVKKSRKRIVRASVGLLIMLSAWIITNFVLRGVLLGPPQTPNALQPGGSSNFGNVIQIDRYPR